MIAPFPATSSRTSHPAPEPTSAASAPASRLVDWGARLVQVGLAIYLLPVLIVIFLIGGLGIAIVGLAVLAARFLRWSGRSHGVEEREDGLGRR